MIKFTYFSASYIDDKLNDYFRHNPKEKYVDLKCFDGDYILITKR